MNTKHDPQDKFSFNEVPVYVVDDIIKTLKTSKFFCVATTNLNAYADDNQLHFSHESPMAIETAINEDLKQSMIWFDENSLKATPDKFQSFSLTP